jgi:predicted PurR-regulated permease PerM
MEKNWEITWSSLWRILSMLALIGILYLAFDIWIAVFLSIVISSALDPAVSWLERKRIPRVIGALSIFILFVLAIALILYTLFPLVLAQFNILLKSFGELESSLLDFPATTKILEAVNKNLGRFTNLLLSGSAPFFETISALFGGIVLTISTFVLSFYLIISRDGVEKFLRAVIPTGYEEDVLQVYFKTRRRIGRWFYGQFFLSLSVGLAVFIGLSLIGVKYSLIIGILAGLLEIVPFVGPIVSGAIAFLIAISESWMTGLYVFLFFVLVQQAESILLTPMFMRLTTSLHPALILISLLVGARLFGFVGIIIAVPIGVAVQEIMDRWSYKKVTRKTAVSA